MYLTYDEYIEYGGELTLHQFEDTGYAAERKLKALTHSRIDKMAEIPEAVKRCMVMLIAVEASAKQVRSGEDRAPVSFSNDGYSENYGTARDAGYFDDLFESTAEDYLLEETDDNGVPLLYKGV